MRAAVAGIGALLLAVVLSGCTKNVSPDTYSVGSVGQVNRAVRGEVISVRSVKIEGTSGVGTTAGAGAGAVAGSALGSGTRGNILGAIGGAVVGGIVGAVAEEGLTSQSGYEYVIQTTNGALLTLVQGGEPFATGQKVIVMYGSQSRIIADSTTQ